ncbi:hypothetical protein F5Y17DRAFT_462955 [Xylariaceae sp. FL0594]|nr:hypothetical protein F5Y17DRAFT_462955 [Xylariaceae sp. FL0594]
MLKEVEQNSINAELENTAPATPGVQPIPTTTPQARLPKPTKDCGTVAVMTGQMCMTYFFIHSDTSRYLAIYACYMAEGELNRRKYEETATGPLHYNLQDGSLDKYVGYWTLVLEYAEKIYNWDFDFEPPCALAGEQCW